MQELQKSRKHKLVVTLELPSFPHAVLYNQTIVGPRHAGAIEDPSSPSASLLPLYDPEVSLCELHCHWTSFSHPPPHSLHCPASRQPLYVPEVTKSLTALPLGLVNQSSLPFPILSAFIFPLCDRNFLTPQAAATGRALGLKGFVGLCNMQTCADTCRGHQTLQHNS